MLLDAVASLPPDIAVLMIEHDMHVVRRFATEVYVLVHGQSTHDGTARRGDGIARGARGVSRHIRPVAFCRRGTRCLRSSA